MDINYWTEFLFKKIEQINQKDTITGVTNWAIIGVLGFLTSKVYNIFTEINLIANA